MPRLSKLKDTCVTGAGWEFFSPLAWLWLNNRSGPLANKKVRQAIMVALDQQAFVDSVVGDQQELAIVPTGLFAPTMPMSNQSGLEHLTAPRDIALNGRICRKS